MTDAEKILWSRLRRRSVGDLRFRRQHPTGPYIVDFGCVLSKFIIEIDGGTHSAEEEMTYDQRREAYLTSLGWRVMRFSNHDVYKHLTGVLESIWHHAPPPPPSAAPPP